MNKFWERFFYVLSYLTMGSSYLSPRTYAILHRLHHAYADQPEDPHSPLYSPNVFAMMWKTARIYSNIDKGKMQVPEKFKARVPDWPALDRLGDSWFSRIGWIVLYVAFYIFFAPSLWWYLLLPVQIVMSPVHGAIINWFAHKYGYVNNKVGDTSRNLFPLDLIMLGEGYHNNHHKYASSINFGERWFEIDPVYYVIRLLAWLRVVKLKQGYRVRKVTEF